MGHRQILVGQRPAAILGLDAMFDGLYEQSRCPSEPDLGPMLIEQAPRQLEKLAAVHRSGVDEEWEFNEWCHGLHTRCLRSAA